VYYNIFHTHMPRQTVIIPQMFVETEKLRKNKIERK
jgi:hypothetical protein